MPTETEPTIRHCSLDDVAIALSVLQADEEHVLGRPSRLEAADLRSWWSSVELATDSWLVHDDGQPVGLAWVEPNGDAAVCTVSVVPGARGRGHLEVLLGLTERRAAECGKARIHQVGLAGDEQVEQLVLGRGYHEVRRFWDMAIELTEPPVVPALPDGLALGPIREDEIRAYHAASDEAFADHWEHHSLSFDEWWERQAADPHLDLTLWFVVRDGDEIVAGVRNEPQRSGGGFVASLAVRRPWRGRGLARALLLTSFREFYARGQHRVTLGVDSANPTGATRLYESVGMAPELETVVWEKPADSG